MNIQVLLFARLRELLGSTSLSVDISDGATVGDVIAQLEREHAALLGQSFAAAVNQCYSERDQVLKDCDELALIPPVSGG